MFFYGQPQLSSMHHIRDSEAFFEFGFGEFQQDLREKYTRIKNSGDKQIVSFDNNRHKQKKSKEKTNYILRLDRY